MNYLFLYSLKRNQKEAKLIKSFPCDNNNTGVIEINGSNLRLLPAEVSQFINSLSKEDLRSNEIKLEIGKNLADWESSLNKKGIKLESRSQKKFANTKITNVVANQLNIKKPMLRKGSDQINRRNRL